MHRMWRYITHVRMNTYAYTTHIHMKRRQMFKKEKKENHLGLGHSSGVEFLPSMLEALGSIHNNFL